MSGTSFKSPDELISAINKLTASPPKDQLVSVYKNWIKRLDRVIQHRGESYRKRAKLHLTNYYIDRNGVTPNFLTLQNILCTDRFGLKDNIIMVNGIKREKERAPMFQRSRPQPGKPRKGKVSGDSFRNLNRRKHPFCRHRFDSEVAKQKIMATDATSKSVSCVEIQCFLRNHYHFRVGVCCRPCESGYKSASIGCQNAWVHECNDQVYGRHFAHISTFP
jgi:hypothetical protein